MTSESDNLKTNEFLRLRKLRLQQVREQSKDIAKKIRHRAKVEQLKHVTNVNTNKEKLYQQQQERLVTRLEQLYSKSLANVGAGHKNAAEVNLKGKDIPVKKDLSKLRGKEAAAELRRSKQAKLDEQKKLLDRKLLARDAANELSREKSVAIANNLQKSSSGKSINKGTELIENAEGSHKDKSDAVTKADMATQWEFAEIPNEWEPNIPALSIPKDDSVKNSANDNVDKADKSKRLNLFALSDEMPSSLRGGATSIPDVTVPVKTSLTLVSEYLQNRGLRLREPDTTAVQKKSSDDLQSIKQTLLKTRASRTDGSVYPNIYDVLDEQAIPVPCWRAERNWEYCSYYNKQHRHLKPNNINNSLNLKSGLQENYSYSVSMKPCTWTPHNKCNHRQKVPVSGRSNNIGRSTKTLDNALRKKSSVTVYDHNTRDTRDLPHNVEKIVIRDQSNDDDAYSQALMESEIIENHDKPQHSVQQEMRNRIAVTKQNVEKEYRDTLAFLNSLPKEKPTRSVRMAYMDDARQQETKDKRQQRLQEEYKKIVKECSKRHCKHTKCKTSTLYQNRSQSKSPVRIDSDNNVVDRDFQYSWLPVPESDGSLAIHTIPNISKDKPGNTVKFSSVDTYHEYRSRHKHTPPTKDVNNDQNKRGVEAVIIHENSNDSADFSYDTDTSSVENLQVRLNNTASHRADDENQLADAERIIIYKVMESKTNKNPKTKRKAVKKTKEREHNLPVGDIDVNKYNSQELGNYTDIEDVNKNTASFAHLKEGIYKSVNANRDNITSMYFTDDKNESKDNQDSINNSKNAKTVLEKGGCNTVNEDGSHNRDPNTCGNCKYKKAHANQHSEKQTIAATSTSSFKTALNDKVDHTHPDGGYIKFVDEGGHDAGKFYVGASGFLKDDAYEVIIQLRKKETEKNTIPTQDKVKSSQDIVSSRTTNENIDKESLTNQPMPANAKDDKQINSPKPFNEVTGHKSTSKESLLPSPNVIRKENPASVDTENNFSTQPRAESNSSERISDEERPKISDKNTSTSFHDTFAIPDHVPKINGVPRPAVSTYTQTTLSSPTPRPVLMHLSSSTSTTYLSPPDLILPKYLRKGSSETYDDTYGHEWSNLNSHTSRSKDGKSKCGKCIKHHNHMGTPPNTARSTDRTTDSCYKLQQKNCTRTGLKHKKPKLHKCKSKYEPKICSKRKFKRQNIGSSYSTSPNKNNKLTSNLAKTNLNPVIESYVKKLLNLNKQGLKAIEVVNQECSGVPTPGSSIIDVPSNVNTDNPLVCNKISLEEIKKCWKEELAKNFELQNMISKSNFKTTGSQTDRILTALNKSYRKRPVHKVKSLNISRQLMKRNRENQRESAQSTIITTSPVSNDSIKHNSNINSIIERSEFKKLPTPRRMRYNRDNSNNTSNSDTKKCCRKPPQYEGNVNTKRLFKKNSVATNYPSKVDLGCGTESYTFPSHRATSTHYSGSETSNVMLNRQELSTPPISISTQTNQVDSEVELMTLAENKIQNMEKIADLTEKCTQRLSNLAKVLEEVRKNKSLAYSQISTSDTTSDSDQKSDKNAQANNYRLHAFNPTVEIQKLSEVSSLPTSPKDYIKDNIIHSTAYVPILTDIPKPVSINTPSPALFSTENEKTEVNNVVQQSSIKHRGKPPPALTRINLKHATDGFVVPHELSTVVEVDSPMSVKHKSHTMRLESKRDDSNSEILDNNMNLKDNTDVRNDPQNTSRDLKKGKYKRQSADSSDDSKIKMMDLKQFNEIMLKPFISLNDYAKQYNLDEPDDRSSRNGISKDEQVNEDLSSLHSEVSLPDVMSELLKRNLISEPFKFETTSNVNSTTVSSESTLSLLALSKVRKEKKKSGIVLKNKENVAETSESFSISSNPDLENAFQTFGMGWASSTLKKTKERLALSSSSNTSSSSIPQFKLKSFNYQDLPELSKDSLNISNKKGIIKTQEGSISESAKNALQQTSLTNSMTVKEFLENELAKKITFSNKSNKNATADEFISLCETKMPEEMRRLSQKFEGNDKSTDSPPNGANNRARTSTPVQIFKSMTYHSTSSSNVSNGLFSNAEELSSVKVTSNSNKNHSTSDKDDLTIPNYSLKMRKGLSDCSKSD